MKLKQASVFLLYFILQAVHATSSVEIEKQISATVAKQNKAQITLLKKLVNIQSGTANAKAVHSVGNVLQPLFEKLGFETYWVNMPANMQHAGTLVAEKHGTQGKHVLLIGHLDTVFSSKRKAPPFTIKNDWAAGQGVVDDKGGIVVMLSALSALNTHHALNNTNITIILTGDEEESSKPVSISRKALFNAAKTSDVALDFEAAMTLDTATIARRGIMNWTILTAGNESHSATIFQKAVGDGAIFELARILNTMRTQLTSIKNITFNPGMVIGGTTIQYNSRYANGSATGRQNVIAKTALATGDFRYSTADEQNQFISQIQIILQQHLPETKASVAMQKGIPPMMPTVGNLALLKQYSDVSRDLGFGPVQSFSAALRGAGDISYVATIVPQNLAGLGPIGWGTHSSGEKVDLTSIPIQAQRAAVLIYRLTR